MLKKKFISLCAILCLSLFSLNAFAVTDALNSANGKYAILLQQINCPSDRSTYGEFRDYGYWGGGNWCGKTGKAGYWVWVYPNWHVWQDKMPSIASASGKYTNLLQQINCPNDSSKYGEFRDYGYWGGGSWCAQAGKAGYWVWVYPYWYVWQDQMPSTPPAQAFVNGKYTNLLQQINCPSDRSKYGEFRDYGHWGGGKWCGQSGKAGYWVWVYPNWYVWQNELPPMASANSKYTNLLQQLNCPSDRSKYGEFRDYGYWAGGKWCGQSGKKGYWVWVYPNWYVWEAKLR